MTIHYQNAKGEEMMISGIVHLQNVDDETWCASTTAGKEITLRTDRIDGIYADDTKTRNITREREAETHE